MENMKVNILFTIRIYMNMIQVQFDWVKLTKNKKKTKDKTGQWV